jgi:hypothetical protein
VETLSISADTAGIDRLIDGRMSARLHKALAFGVRASLAITEQVHQGIVRNIGTGGDAWTVRTGKAAASFHIAHRAGSTEGAYGSELKRVGVLEMGSQVALGGPMKSNRGPGKYLAIPTARARVGKGEAVWPSKWPEGSLVFVRSHKGNPLLIDPRTGAVMFVLRSSVTIPPHPTLPRTQERAQPKIDATMLAAVDAGLAEGGAK